MVYGTCYCPIQSLVQSHTTLCIYRSNGIWNLLLSLSHRKENLEEKKFAGILYIHDFTITNYRNAMVNVYTGPMVYGTCYCPIQSLVQSHTTLCIYRSDGIWNLLLSYTVTSSITYYIVCIQVRWYTEPVTVLYSH